MKRLTQLKSCAAKDVLKTTREWVREGKIDKRTLWATVRLGTGIHQGKETRIRACRLATELLSRWRFDAPQPYFDPAAVSPLVSCFGADDPQLVASSAQVLAMANTAYPGLQIRHKLHKRIVFLLRHQDKELAKAGIDIAMTSDGRFASEIAGAWMRHTDDTAFAEHCLDKLRALLSLRLQAAIRLKHPEWKAKSAKEAWEIGRKIKAEAKPEIEALSARLGRDPALWERYWQGEVRASPPTIEQRPSRPIVETGPVQRREGAWPILAIVMLGGGVVLIFVVLIIKRRTSR